MLVSAIPNPPYWSFQFSVEPAAVVIVVIHYSVLVALVVPAVSVVLAALVETAGSVEPVEFVAVAVCGHPNLLLFGLDLGQT